LQRVWAAEPDPEKDGSGRPFSFKKDF